MEKIMVEFDNKRQAEKGNVLFLILIAVALFAALSYAVTQSTRSGSGTADKEKSLLSGASMTQYPTALRTSIVRMVLSGTDISDIFFDTPAGFSAMSDVASSVFHPTGGGAVYQEAPADLMAANAQGRWFFNANWDIPEIGIDGPGGNDVIAFLPGINSNICRGINEEFSIPSPGPCGNTDPNEVVPEIVAGGTANIRENFEEGDTFPVGNQDDIVSTGCEAFHGQPSGCFYEPDNSEYVFYSVLLER